MADGIKATIVGLLTLALLVGLGIAAWQFSWFVEEKSVDRRVGIENRNTGTQTAWRDQVHDNMAEIEMLTPDSPARQNLISNACDLAGRLTDTYQDDQIDMFLIEYCT